MVERIHNFVFILPGSKYTRNSNARVRHNMYNQLAGEVEQADARNANVEASSRRLGSVLFHKISNPNIVQHFNEVMVFPSLEQRLEHPKVQQLAG